MPKRKADSLSQASASNGGKKIKHNESMDSKPLKEPNLLVDGDSESESDEDVEGGGALLDDDGFKINEEYAKRFEHNKKREELQKLEEKYEKEAKPAKGQYGDKYDEDEDSSSDEDEDDEGFLATEDLDAQISATLQAIRNRDPRVYDEKITFYTPIEEEAEGVLVSKKQEKPMYLRDYHRENLLAGHIDGGDEEDDAPPVRTFAQEQDDLKKSIVTEMHAAAGPDDSSEDDDDTDEGFLKPKPKAQETGERNVHPSRASKVRVEVDVSKADKDPEMFLSNFMAARAWVPSDGARFQPLESDDEEDDERAEKFEAAYNLRFEDPEGSNEILKSYARDIVAAKSVRREEPKGRKKQREAEREKKELENREREEERARLRRLKIEQMEEKLQKIRNAAGIKGKVLKDEEWSKFLDEGWDDDKWEEEMNKRFGEDFYAQQEADEDSDEEHVGGSKKKVKKPKWDDDIDINDIIPEFVDDAGNERPAFTLSDSDSEDEEMISRKAKSSKERKQERADKKKAARLQRQRIEELVDTQLDVDHVTLASRSKEPSRFRYRETSPTSFGLTPRDILLAPDTALNQFVGLKKIASFRDTEKKRRDKKRLNKKARLREWRKETFGNEDGPEVVIGAPSATPQDVGAVGNANGVDIVEGGTEGRKGKKHRRSRKSKSGDIVEA
ncbi:MAG: KRRI-Interacting protein 1 [Claussenomyces sp. TS43310]|nr:MAG: KRRI-Interacting protein 1 [Claussenomyces sp. TS43310]